VIKSIRLEWAENVAGVGERSSAYRVLMGKPEGKSHLQDLGIDGRIVLKRISNKSFGRTWTGFILA
jgi:hypothetical protein